MGWGKEVWCLLRDNQIGAARNALRAGGFPKSAAAEALAWEAAIWRGAEVVACVLESGASPNCLTTHGVPPLALAAGAGEIETARALIKWGADVSWAGAGQESALTLAVAMGNAQMVSFLIRSQARLGNEADPAWIGAIALSPNSEAIEMVKRARLANAERGVLQDQIAAAAAAEGERNRGSL